MFQELKKRVNLAFISQLGIAFVIFPLLVAIWKGGFAQELITKARACFQEPIEINPGEDLSQYANQNVRCTFKYVINSVVNFYHTDDPDKAVYTCGFVVLDENMENPFCVFVPPTKQAQMEELMNETWKIERGESNGETMSSVTVEGRVMRSEEKIYNYYLMHCIIFMEKIMCMTRA